MLTNREKDDKLCKQFIQFDYPKLGDLMDAKKEKLDFLKGTSDAMYYFKDVAPIKTSYCHQFTGQPVVAGRKAEIIQRFRTTCSGNAIPDPS